MEKDKKEITDICEFFTILRYKLRYKSISCCILSLYCILIYLNKSSEILTCISETPCTRITFYFCTRLIPKLLISNQTPMPRKIYFWRTTNPTSIPNSIQRHLSEQLFYLIFLDWHVLVKHPVVRVHAKRWSRAAAAREAESIDHGGWRMVAFGCARRQRDGNARMKDREWPGQPWYGAGTRAEGGGAGESILECRGYSRSRGDPGTRPCPGDARRLTTPLHSSQLHLGHGGPVSSVHA